MGVMRGGGIGTEALAVEVDHRLPTFDAAKHAIGREQTADGFKVAIVHCHTVTRKQLTQLLSVIDTAHCVRKLMQISFGHDKELQRDCP